MGYNAFDDAEEGSRKGARVPFWTLDFEDEKALLEWLNTEYDYRVEQAQDRIVGQRKNLAAYRGIHYQAQDARTREVDVKLPRSGKHQKIVINQMIDMVEQDVARLTKYRGAVAAVPPSEDYNDRVVAKIGEDLVKAKWEKEEIDFHYQKLHRRKRIFGEDFMFVGWNPHLGHYHPDYVAEVFERAGIKKNPKDLSPGEIRDIFRKEIKEIPRLPLVDPKTGEQMQGADGKPLFIDKPIRVGDIEYKLIMSWDMFLERRKCYEDVENGFFRECMNVEDVKADHPGKGSKITPDANFTWFDPENLEEQARENHVEVKHFYHKATHRLGQGRYIKFTRNAILINKPNQYVGPDGAILPWEPIFDIMTPGILNGESFVTQGRPAQAIYNQVVSMRVRNQFLHAHPKWFYQKGSVKPENLGNDSTLVPVSPGATSPELRQPALASSEQSALRSEAKEDLQQIMQVYAVSRGETPTGVTAASALMFMDEQESDRANPGIAAHTRHQRAVALRTLWLMADHYDDTDGRLEALLGKTRASEIKYFKMADLTRISDIRIQNSSALPQQKSAKLQFMIDMKQNFPGVLTDDQAADLMGLADVDKFQNIISTNIRAAESENDSMLRTGEPSEPNKVQNHLIHYRTHTRAMSDPSFSSLPEKIRKAYEDHLMATEMLMTEIMARNPAYLQAVVTEFPQFPVFYVEAEAVVSPPALPPEELGAGPVAADPALAAAQAAPAPGPMQPMEMDPMAIAPGQGLEADLTQGVAANV